MKEHEIALVAVAMLLAALVGAGSDEAAVLTIVPWPVALVPVVVAWVTRTVPIVLVAFVLLAAWRGAGERAAWEAARLDAGPLTATVEVVADPEPIGLGVPGVRAEARLADGRRVALEAYGAPAGALGRTTVGSRLLVEGTARPAGDGDWDRIRHLTGRVSVTQAVVVGDPTGAWALAEALRARVAAGAAGVDADRRALYLGLVTGDDRDQDAAQQARFRVAGLSHLLAVSGQNVAFVLSVVGPVVRRLPIGMRFAAVAGVLVVFVLVTRLEPSVVRATVTASAATWAALTGRRAEGVRALSIAVGALVVIDPFLAGAVGFQLSVAASAGIVLGAPAIVRRLGGPPWLAMPAAVTLSAQAAVAPLLWWRFGPLGVVSLPANLLAGWAAGLVMMWGVGVGVVLGGWAAAVAWPVDGLVWWIDAVARVAVRAPLPRVEGGVVAASVVWWWVARTSPGVRRRVRALVVAFVVAARPGMVAGPSQLASPVFPHRAELVGVEWFAGPEGAVVVVGAGADRATIEVLVAHRVRAVTVVATTGSRRSRAVVAAVVDVVGATTVIAPPVHRIRGAWPVRAGAALPIRGGTLVLTPSADGTVLEVEARAGPSP